MQSASSMNECLPESPREMREVYGATYLINSEIVP